jgi:hypothetical protein
MALKLTTKGAVRFSWADDSMEAIFTLNPGDSQEELVSKLERIVNFVHEREGKPPLPERIPGMALGMAQTAHPAPVGNGWASVATPAAPELPEDRKGEWELYGPEEQG